MEFSALNERDALSVFLDRQRAALVRQVDGISDVDARRTPTASSLSLLGLLKHATVWEQRWFQGVVAGLPLPDGWPEIESAIPDDDFQVGVDDTIEGWIARYHAATEMARQLIAGSDLDQLCTRADVVDCNVRSVLLHMIEETARHAGHADIIRETLDGSRGA